MSNHRVSFRSLALAGRHLALAGLSLAVHAAPAAAGWLTPPVVPPGLAVPSGAKLTAHLHGIGEQVYGCAAAPGAASFGWILKRPDAALFDDKNAPSGTHGAGPIWTAKDGSTVTGKKIAEAPAPKPEDAIPWLLLRAEKTAGKGVFAKITFIQRLNTKKGKPPTSACGAGQAGSESRVQYSADYYFYEGGG